MSISTKVRYLMQILEFSPLNFLFELQPTRGYHELFYCSILFQEFHSLMLSSAKSHSFRNLRGILPYFLIRSLFLIRKSRRNIYLPIEKFTTSKLEFKYHGIQIQNSNSMQRLKTAILAIFQKGLGWPCPVSAALKNAS